MTPEERELLASLAEEARRRADRIIAGVEPAASSRSVSPEVLEELRTEAHALRGAAAVLGQNRLFELGRGLEGAFADALGEGRLGVREARAIVVGAEAFHQGAEAAARGSGEPPSVLEAIETLAA